MSKSRTAYVCQTCGSSRPKWMGRCPDCGEWNTMVETLIEPPSRSTAQAGVAQVAQGVPSSLSDITIDGNERLPVAMEEFGRVLGGGIVPGSVILVGGDPGIGKSTLLLQLAAVMSTGAAPVLYVSGEESVHQVKMRAERLGIHSSGLYVLAENSLEQILLHIEQMRPGLAVVDSIQSIHMEGLASAAGSISQVRECANALDQNGQHRRTARLGAHRGHRAISRGGALSHLPVAAQRQESLWLYQRGGRVRDAR